MSEALYYNIYEIVNEIPVGHVATYQLIAQLLGRPKNCRLVGSAMRCASFYGDFPCHRVVHADGSLVKGWDEQKALLLDEGVRFKPNGKVDIASSLWDIRST